MNPADKNQGIILITAIFIVFLIATLGIGYLSVVNNQMEMAVSAVKSTKAFYLAETGIAEAILILKPKDAWNEYDTGDEVTSPEDSEGNGYWVNVAEPGGKDEITVESTGKFSNFHRIIRVTLDKITVPGQITKSYWEEIE